MQNFETVIIGAGLIGSSTAMHLAKLGATGIAVIDVDLEGKLSSSELNAGGARASWDHPVNIALAKISLEYLHTHKQEVGFHDTGYFWLFTAAHWQAAQERASKLTKLGIPIELLSPEKIQQKRPFLNKLDDVAGATFAPKDGLFNPNLLKLDFRKKAREAGVTFLDGHRVKNITIAKEATTIECDIIPPTNDQNTKDFLEKNKTQEQNLKKISLQTKNLVNCAGAWSARLAKLIGYDCPTYPLRRQVSIFACRELDMRQYGMTVDTSGVYFHPEADQILAGYADPEEKPGFNLEYDGLNFFEEKIWLPLYERSTYFEKCKHITGWAGLYEMTPDKTAILGAVAGFKNIYEAHGFSGRGAMQSYAAGCGLAELIHTGKFQTLDLSPMSASRFASNALLPEGLHI